MIDKVECGRILGLQPRKEYKIEDVKKKYRKLCLKYHPDKLKKEDPEYDEKIKIFMRINHAYNILTNKEYEFAEVKKEGEYLKRFLNVTIYMNLSFVEAFFGSKLIFNFNSEKIKIRSRKTNKKKPPKIINKINVKDVEIYIPPGRAFQQEPLVLPGKGISQVQGDTTLCGDFIVTFNVNPDPIFKIDGNNVRSIVRVDLEKMLKGGEINVLTMYGVKEVVVPPVSQPNCEIEIPKCGIDKKGSHIATLDMIYPEKSDVKNKKFFKDTKINWNLEESKEEKQMQEFEKMFNDMAEGVFKNFNFNSTTDTETVTYRRIDPED